MIALYYMPGMSILHTRMITLHYLPGMSILHTGMIVLHDVTGPGIPVGIQDISRWLSGATPPVTRRPLPRPHPGGMTDASS